MTPIDLNTLLSLVGTLNDNTEKDSASERFRSYLRTNIIQSADIRAYTETALELKGDQYNKALQDLINHLGTLLGFKVRYGRYRGVRNQIGYDGLWQSPTGWSVVVETKTTDVYTVRTATLLGYINTLVSDGDVSNQEKVIGLYVYGRFDGNTNQLENAITVENRRGQLRVVTVLALLNLLELKEEYGLSHESVLQLLLPAPIRIDPIVDLIKRVVSQEQEKDVFTTLLVEQSKVPDVGSPASTSSSKGAFDPHDKGALDFTGKTVSAVVFEGNRIPVNKWREAFEALLAILVEHDRVQFEQVAATVVGRKRPYFSLNPDALRKAALVSGTTLHYETNLSANHMTRVAYVLIERLGHAATALKFETVEDDQ